MGGQELPRAPGAEGAPIAARRDWPLLLERYGRLVYSVPRRFGLPPEDCDDVYQATWLTVVSRADPPLDEAGGVTVRWLASIAAWETRNLLRRRRMPVGERALLEAVETDPEALPERIEELVEQHVLVEEALASLPLRDRQIVTELFLADEPRSYAEIAGRLGVAVGSVGPMRLRAIERLRTELLDRGFRAAGAS